MPFIKSRIRTAMDQWCVITNFIDLGHDAIKLQNQDFGRVRTTIYGMHVIFIDLGHDAMKLQNQD